MNFLKKNFHNYVRKMLKNTAQINFFLRAISVA